MDCNATFMTYTQTGQKYQIHKSFIKEENNLQPVTATASTFSKEY